MDKYLHEYGYFIQISNQEWEEWQGNVKAFTFQESERTNEWITLYDGNRKIFVSLPVNSKQAYFMWVGQESWTPLFDVTRTNVTPQPHGAIFTFTLRTGESFCDRMVRCCMEVLEGGTIGQNKRHDVYREFISCRQEENLQDAEELTKVRSSCAMFVRAVLHWCGINPTGPYKPDTAMFVSMGNVSLSHPAFVTCNNTNKPNPGDYFYIQTEHQNNGHTGIFIKEIGDNEWKTAEGGQGDGTECCLRTRKITGKKFSDSSRKLWGWFDCTKVGLPNY